ncbi:epidermal growth factor receptor substrate 15 homolog isoform X2 [Plodia interpunctella]|uniref:epidermal growth factor receptor substrate 15 homolog isoform X2 n=1 Tax=Plodia interpunctella TaxID=58824 RepID=UPI002367BB58|nr:epidermal growth factor receptor substrate 15 homolog isoform X2 [Plodia interpunctella]
MADAAPPTTVEAPQESNTADTACPASLPIPQEPKPIEPAVQQNAIAPETSLEPDNKEVPPPELIPESQSAIAEQAQQPEPAKTEPKPEPEANPLEPAAGDNAVQNSSKQDIDWKLRETELLKKIVELEKVKSQSSEHGLKLELKVREEEIDLLKARVKNLETELQAALSKPGGKNHEMIENIKQQHEELLSKARGMIFDKTKMVKNQELQIEALTTQVQSLKDINLITKDLLEIRNSEVKAMEERLQAMEARFKAEKERYGLVLQRAQTSTNINDDLRKEYETQLGIFKELRGKYEQRVQALVAENAKLKELNVQLKAMSGPSG